MRARPNSSAPRRPAGSNAACCAAQSACSAWAARWSSAIWGRAWMPPIASFLQLDSAVAINWALALGACVGVTWLTDQLRRHREQAAHAA